MGHPVTSELPSSLKTPYITKRIGRRVLAAAIVVNLLVIFYSIFALYNSRQQDEALAETQTQNTAHVLSQSVAYSIDKVRLFGSMVKYDVERQLALGHVDYTHLEHIIRHQTSMLPADSSIRIFNAAGEQIWAMSGITTIPANIADRDYFMALKQAQGNAVAYSKPITSRFADGKVIVVAYRINHPNGNFAGIVAAPITIKHLESLMADINMGNNGMLGLRDRDLTLFLRLPHLDSGSSQDIGAVQPTSTLRQLVEDGATYGSYRAIAHIDNSVRIFSFRKLQNAPIYVLAGQAEIDYLAQWRIEAMQTGAFVLVFMLVTAIASWLLYCSWKRQVRATEELNESHKSLNHYVEELRYSQQHIKYLAFHDKLTGLPNRVMLVTLIEQALAQAEHAGCLLGICFIDVDGFTSINDNFGNQVGDQVLIEIGARLNSSMRTGDSVARLGGDEFVVMLHNRTQPEEIESEAQRILTLISQPVKVASTETQLTASIGVSVYPDDVSDAELLIRHADQAMCIAKNSGKNRYHLFDSEADRNLRHRHLLLQHIEQALEKEQFTLYYQPKVDMLAGQVIGAEALIRWQDPERGLLGPAEFLPVLENTQLAITLGEWVIRHALKQMSEWLASGLVLPVSVNVSGFHLQQQGFVQQLAAYLAERPEVTPKSLQIEILETTAMDDIETVSKIIDDCEKLGVNFSLDDFGTGYSSLTYFRRLPTHELKIDRSFVKDMLNNASDYALIESVVKLAQTFQRSVIAEGVETAEQGLALINIGCHLGQGFGISRPMPPEDMPRWIANWEPPPSWHEGTPGSGI